MSPLAPLARETGRLETRENMPQKTTSSTIRASLEEQHKFEALRRYYEKRNYDETGVARRFTHREVLALLLEEPGVKEKWQQSGHDRLR